ncbi:MAG: hypothetical protein JSW09_08145 [Pseudomonadota bacterium]|nr:MAG: hypothetical protein JSW09_08145 [Pseudomonadota bacterium]
MKNVSLQMIAVDLENGQRGVFIGVPLISEERATKGFRIEDVWFSSVQELPEDLTIAKLIRMVGEQLALRQQTVQ